MKKTAAPYWFIIAIACLWWLPNLFAKGMFMDGIYDALLAHNLATGISSFWAPQTIYYRQPAYWDNPPLAMYFLSVWYKVLGDSYFVERIYSFSCAIVQLLLISGLWKAAFCKQNEILRLSWLPCLVFLISPLTPWCYANNLMENTMSLFTSLSVLTFLMYWQKRRNILLYAALGGLLIFLACITKGPVGLFPLATPIFFVLVGEKVDLKKNLTYTLFQAFVFILLFTAVFSLKAPRIFLRNYLEVQLLPVLQHQSPTSDPHYRIFVDLLLAVLPWLVMLLITSIAKSVRLQKNGKNWGLIFLLIGISASLPIALSAKQHKYYLLPSLVFYALSVATFLIPLAESVLIKFNTAAERTVKSVSLAVIVASVVWCFVNVGSYSRDQDLLTDIESIQYLTKNEKVIRADWKLFDAWAMRAYLNRLYNQKLCMPDESAPAHFYITKQNEWGDKLPENSLRVYAGKTFDLYQLPK